MRRVVALAFATLCCATWQAAHAGDRPTGDRPPVFRSRPSPPVAKPPRPPHRFARHHLVVGGLPAPEVVVPTRNEEAAPAAAEREGVGGGDSAPPPGPVEPKILLPPAPSPPGRPGERTIVIQRGHQVEVLTFPLGKKE